MENILIKQAQESDLEAVLSLYAQPLLDGNEVLTIEEALKVFKKMNRYPDYRIYVAQSESKVVGTFALLIMDNLGHLGAKSGLIEDVAVRPEFQRQGIGRQMMQFAFKICRDNKCYKVALSSNLKRDNAHRFYEAIGFQIHGYSFLVDLTHL